MRTAGASTCTCVETMTMPHYSMTMSHYFGLFACPLVGFSFSYPSFWPSPCSFFLLEIANLSPSLLILDVASPPATALTPFVVHHHVRPNVVGPRLCQSLKCFVFCLVWFACLENLNPSQPSFSSSLAEKFRTLKYHNSIGFWS